MSRGCSGLLYTAQPVLQTPTGLYRTVLACRYTGYGIQMQHRNYSFINSCVRRWIRCGSAYGMQCSDDITHRMGVPWKTSPT